MIKRNIFTVVLLTLVVTISSAQDRKSERLEAQKIAYITTELDLSPKESQDFWPIYNEYQSKSKAAKDKLKGMAEGKKIDELTDSEAKQLLAAMITAEQTEVDLKRDYTSRMSSAISDAKIAKLYFLEREFRDKILRKIRRKMKIKGRGGE